MRIERILVEDGRAENAVEANGQYSFNINLAPGQEFSLKTFVSGKKQYNHIMTRQGDQLQFDYNFESRGRDVFIVYEVKLINTDKGTDRLLEDGEFNMNSKEDMLVLKKDISLKLELFDDLLNPQAKATAIEIYKNILNRVD